MQFIGREKELEHMEKLYNKPGFQMIVIYGRRRIGKSTLIKKFIEGKRAVYYTAIKNSIRHNLNNLGNEVISSLVPDFSGMNFSNLEDLFFFMGKQCQDERIVIVLDEFPYFAEADKSFTSVLQSYIDNHFNHGKMYLILCGSSISFMENEVLSEKSPLFGRRTSQLHLKPFHYLDAAKFVPNYSESEKALCFGITGGVAASRPYHPADDHDRP